MRYNSLQFSSSAIRTDSSNLDLLRSIAVLLVLLNHVLSIFQVDAGIGTLPWMLGRVGVLMFFVHTSFVLMLSLERSRRRDSLNHVLSMFQVDAGIGTLPWMLGRVGVLVFFVHTSFVLMLSLERSRRR